MVLFCRAASLMLYRLAYGLHPAQDKNLAKKFKLLTILADMRLYGFVIIS